MQTIFFRCVVVAVALATSGNALAATPDKSTRPARVEIPPDPAADPLMLAAGFLDHHPDLEFRLRGLEAYRAGNFAKARGFLERASLYADKPSQGLYAELLWDGKGGAKDRALAYAWMDLAAERGYRPMLLQRERFWLAMDAAERVDAVARGVSVYARYGDAAAKPRLASRLRRGLLSATGSRTGSVGNLVISINTPGGEITIPGSTFYDPRYWQPEKYWAWQDEVWSNPRRAEVNVGGVENVAPTAKPTANMPAATKED